MRSVLRDTKHVFSILGYIMVVITYWYETRRLELKRVGELRGLLVAVRTEVRINDRILERLTEDPYRLLREQQSLPDTTVWERNGPRLTSLLSAHESFIPEIEEYFETLALLKLDMIPNATEDEIEQILETAQLCEHLGGAATARIHSQIASLEAEERHGK